MEAVRAGRPFAVLDLGTGYVKALLVHRGPTGVWMVVGSAIVSYQRPRGQSGACSPAQLEAAEEALRRAQHMAVRLAGRTSRPATCIISVAEPLATTTLVGQDHQRAEGDPAISGQEAQALRYAAEVAAVAAARQKCTGEGPDAVPLWLGSYWQAAAIDGRPVTGLEGFRSTSVQLELGVAHAGSTALRLRSWSEDRGMKPVLVPEPLWHQAVVSRRSACMVVDVGGRRTQLSYRKQTGGLCRLSIPVGGYHFTRYLSLAAHVSPSRAERVKLAYAGRRLNDPTRSQVRRVMLRALGTWARRLTRALAAGEGILPGRWLSAGGGSSLSELALLPALVPDDSISRFDRYPVWQALSPADVCTHVAPGPAQLGASHLVSLALADWWLGLCQDPAARRDVGRLAQTARQAGFEVDADWLKS